MSEIAKSVGVAGEGNPHGDRPPLRPSWLYPSLTFAVVATHVAFFASGIYWPRVEAVDVATISADLLPEGDFLEEGAPVEAGVPDDSQPAAEIEEAETVLPPPLVLAPDAPPLTEKKEAAEKAKEAEKKRAEDREESRDKERREAQTRTPGGKPGGRFGAPGGRGGGQGTAAAQASCLAQVAALIRRHTPPSTSFGPGRVLVTFYVNSGGGISGVSASGGNPAQAALARRIVSSSHGPSSCGAAFASQGITFQ